MRRHTNDDDDDDEVRDGEKISVPMMMMDHHRPGYLYVPDELRKLRKATRDEYVQPPSADRERRPGPPRSRVGRLLRSYQQRLAHQSPRRRITAAGGLLSDSAASLCSLRQAFCKRR
jgi:hypothetical protein